MPSSFKWFGVVCVLGAASAIAQVVVNQQVQFVRLLPPGGAPGGQASNSGVYVRDSGVALDKIALARRMQRVHEWAKAADVYQEVLEKYRDRVMPSHTDASGTVDQYASVVSEVTHELAEWPPEGLIVYRAKYELPAKALLDSAKGDDLRPLHEVFGRYFVTDSGRQAGLRLVDAYFELGEFSAAAWIGHELLLHPDIAPQRAAVLYRIGLAEHLSGDDDDANQELRQLKTRFPAAVGSVRGGDVILADQLATDLVNTHPVDIAASADNWPMLGGNPSRGKIPSTDIRPGAKLYEVGLVKTAWYSQLTDPTARKGAQDQDAAVRKLGSATGVIPVVDSGEMFFQDNARLSAINIESGLPLPEWEETYSTHDGRFVVPDAIGMASGHQFTVTLTDSDVLAVMNLQDPTASANGIGGTPNPRLVCLDRHTGRQQWAVTVRDLPDAALKDLILGSSPLVVGDNVYVTASATRGNGYEECWVLCFDLGSGAYRWSCYVASASNESTAVDANGQAIANDAGGQLAYASGRLFVSNNLGAVAALDAYNGTIAWLNIYRDSDENNANQMAMMGGGAVQPPDASNSTGQPMPWTASPPIVQGGNVFVLPGDGKYILIYDAGTGRIVQQVRKDDCCEILKDDDPNANTSSAIAQRRPDTLLGIVPQAQVLQGSQTLPTDLLIVATPCRVCAIKWRQYNREHPSAALAWVSEFASQVPAGPASAAPSADSVRAIRGRGFVTASSVVVPTDEALFRIAMRTGRIVDSFPPSQKWADGQEPGNVIVSADHVVIAGQDHVDAYTDLELARSRLEKAIADDPDDADPRLRCAEVMFVADQTDLALKRLDEAMQLLRQQGADGGLLIGPSRDRAFADALSFAARLGDQKPVPVDLINGLFDRAAAAASSATQQVAWRIARAKFAQSAGDDLATSVKLYQEILADSHLRTVPLSEDSDDVTGAGMTQAALAAESAIKVILTDARGKAAYAPYETAAAAQYAQARASQDPQKLLLVSTAYPNSSVAFPALQAAADAFEARSMPRQATQTLRQIYLQLPSPTPVDKARVLESMARNYLHIPDRIDAAVSRMNQAAQLAGDLKLARPITLADGTTLSDATLTAADAALQKSVGDVASVGLPEFDFPSHSMQRQYGKTHNGQPPQFLNEDSSTSLANIDALVRPSPEYSRADRLVTWTTAAGLSIYPAYASQPLGTASEFDDQPKSCAWVPSPTTRPSGDALLAWSNSHIGLLDGVTAKMQWKLDVASLPTVEMMAQAAPDEMPAVFHGNVQIVGGPRGMVRIFRGPNGQIIRIVGNGRLVINGRVFAGAGFNAQPAPVSGGGIGGGPAVESISQVQPVGDLAILSTTTGRVACISLATGEILWQMRLADHDVDRLLTDDDFTVIKVTDNGNVELVVLDTLSGRLLARRTFSPDTGTFPVNVALGDDGTLAFTTPDQLFLFDLYELGPDRRLSQPRFATPQDQTTQGIFLGMAGRDQLLVHGGQILAVCKNGDFVRGYSAQTGQLREYDSMVDGVPQVTQMVLSTGAGANDVHYADTSLTISGEYFYCWSGGGVFGYNLNHPDAHWGEPDPDAPPGRGHELFVGKDALVLLDEPTAAAPTVPVVAPSSVESIPPAPPVNLPQDNHAACRLRVYSRTHVPDLPFTKESGAWFVTVNPLTDPHGFAAWQAVDHGFYYLDTDRHLHVLRIVSNPQ